MVNVSTKDITTKQGCRAILSEASKVGSVDAIFNLAVVLRDELFENQSKENFITAFEPKAQATRVLDELSRKLCPKLRLEFNFF